MNDQYCRPPRSVFRPAAAAGLANNDMIPPAQKHSPPPAGAIHATVPPIPPQPLAPAPYDFNAEGLALRDLLRECLGNYIIAEHQVGISGLTVREGRLTRVEANAYVLEDPNCGDALVCDYYSLKFFRCLADGGRG